MKRFATLLLAAAAVIALPAAAQEISYTNTGYRLIVPRRRRVSYDRKLMPKRSSLSASRTRTGTSRKTSSNSKN